jgi:hypothetical protein
VIGNVKNVQEPLTNVPFAGGTENSLTTVLAQKENMKPTPKAVQTVTTDVTLVKTQPLNVPTVLPTEKNSKLVIAQLDIITLITKLNAHNVTKNVIAVLPPPRTV